MSLKYIVFFFQILAYFKVLKLNEFSRQSQDEFKIILLDNRVFHKEQHLIIPENIALLFIPTFSPELNPAEKFGRK